MTLPAKAANYKSDMHLHPRRLRCWNILSSRCDDTEHNNNQNWFNSSHLDTSATPTSVALDTRRVGGLQSIVETRQFHSLSTTKTPVLLGCERHRRSRARPKTIPKLAFGVSGCDGDAPLRS